MGLIIRREKGTAQAQRNAKQQREHDHNELGDRAARGLQSENQHPWGISYADQEIQRRARGGERSRW